MTFMEWLGYVSRDQYKKTLRHKNEMHELLARRYDRIAHLEYMLTCARDEARRAKARLAHADQSQILGKRISQVIVDGVTPKGIDEDWLQAGPGAKCLWCKKPKPQICEWATDHSGRNRIRRYFCDSECRKAFEIAKTVRASAPSATEYAFGKLPPVNIGNTCSHCSKKIPFAGVTIWVTVDNTTDAQQAATGKTQVLPFCSYDCAREYERDKHSCSGPISPIDLSPGRIRQSPQEQRHTVCHQCERDFGHTSYIATEGGLFDFCSPACRHDWLVARARDGAVAAAVDPDGLRPAPEETASFSAKKLWAETLAALKKHGEEMDAMAAMWGALGVDTGKDQSASPSGSHVVNLNGVEIHIRPAPGTEEEKRVVGAEIMASLAKIERDQLKALNKKLRAMAAEDARRIEELRCRAGDLSDRLEQVEHERDKALADRAGAIVRIDREQRNRLELEDTCAGLGKQLHDAKFNAAAERNRATGYRDRVGRLESRVGTLTDAARALDARAEKDAETIKGLRWLARTTAPLTDAEASDVVLPRIADFDCGEDYVRAWQAAIANVTGKRVQ